jgi:hypothetical protein
MSIENRMNNLEKLILPQKGDKWIVFVCLCSMSGDIGTVLVCRRNNTIQFDNKKDFLNYVKDNKLDGKEVEKICSKTSEGWR